MSFNRLCRIMLSLSHIQASTNHYVLDEVNCLYLYILDTDRQCVFRLAGRGKLPENVKAEMTNDQVMDMVQDSNFEPTEDGVSYIEPI